MLDFLGGLASLVEAVVDLIEAFTDPIRWRGDWNRTSSAVSCLLAFFSAAFLVFVLLLAGAKLLAYL